MNGHFADATAFASTATSVQAISDTLVLHGYHFGGKEFLTSGMYACQKSPVDEFYSS